MWMGSSASFGELRNSVEFPSSATYLPYWEAVNPNPTNTFIGGAALWALTGYVPITNAAYDLAKSEGYYYEVPPAEVGIQQFSFDGVDWTKGYCLGFYVQMRDVMNREFAHIMS